MIENIFRMILISFAVAMLWAPLLIKVLYRYNITRHIVRDFSALAGERYLKAGTPLMGGLLVVVTVIALTLITNWNPFTYVPILVLIPSALLGGFDDVLNIYGKRTRLLTVRKQITLAKVHRRFWHRLYYWVTLPWTAYQNLWYVIGSNPGKGIQAGEKIIVQVITGCIVAWWIYGKLGWSMLWLPWIGPFDIGWGMPLLIVFTVVAMANAVNVVDGMDGLSSGSLLAAFSAYLFLSVFQGNRELALLNATVIGALLAYLYYNIKPARIQMGDVGSLALGTLLATIAFLQGQILLLPIIGFVFVAGITSSIIQTGWRAVFGRRLFRMAPIHLHFYLLGWSEEKVVMRFWLFAIVFAVLGVWLSFY